MPSPFTRKTEEEKAARAAQKDADREVKAREKLRRAFYDSPAGEARAAYESGAKVFQYETDVKATKAVVRPIFLGGGAKAKEKSIGSGPVDTLNAVSNEGWEIVNASFVFVETGQASRDKAVSTGQQVAIAGTVVGYYLFKRNEAHKLQGTDPWEASDEEAVALADEIPG